MTQVSVYLLSRIGTCLRSSIILIIISAKKFMLLLNKIQFERFTEIIEIELQKEINTKRVQNTRERLKHVSASMFFLKL